MNSEDCSSHLHEYCNICECSCHIKHLYCRSCGKQVSTGFIPTPTDTPDGGIIVRACIECPECIEKKYKQDNPLQHELLDLITLMPDTQTEEIINYIMKLREIRRERDNKG